MACKGVCHRYKGRARYDTLDNKKCSVCQTFVIWSGKFCPCCGQMLSYKPNSAKNRKKLREKLGIKEAS